MDSKKIVKFMDNKPLVSVIIPCRNEEKYIGHCLDSILGQDYSKIEIVVVDGLSEDKTKEILAKYQQQHSFIGVFDNPKKTTPISLNIGIKNSGGEIVVFIGSHASYEKDYLSKCVKYLQDYKADNVGGRLITVPAENTVMAKAIAFVLSSFFGSGNSSFRTIGENKVLPNKERHGSSFRADLEKPKWVDTVFGGCYRKKVFQKIGLFNEDLIRSQDMELNLRLKKSGGKILLAPDIVAYYYPKANFKDFFVHNFNDGIWALYPLKFVKTPLKIRHYIPLIFVLSLITTGLLTIFLPVFIYLFLFIVCLYLLTTCYFSFKITIKEKDARYLFLMPAVFASRHIGYGLGSIWGLLKLFN